MSTLVMVEKNGVACIAADTLTSYDSWTQPAKYTVRPEKILHVGDAYLGVVGPLEHRNVLESVLVGGWALADMRSELELFEFALGMDCQLNEAYQLSQMTVFLLNRSGLFGLYPNRAVEQYRRFAAVGSGAGFALGAMYAAYELDAEVEDIARLGVEAGCEFDNSSQGPITLKKLKLYA